MIFYPTIELQQGRCATLNKGNFDDPMIWHVDPVQTVRDFAAAGVEWMHVTDFDGILGEAMNNEILEEIIRVVGIPCADQRRVSLPRAG